MIRKAIIALLTLAAAGLAIMSIVSHKTPLIYFSDKIDQPTFWKLYTAQVDRGRLHIAFESTGEFVIISEDELPSIGPRSLPPLTPKTLRERIADMGFYVYCSALWSYGGGEDSAGNHVYVKARSRSVGLGAPAWFLIAGLASYPVLVGVRTVARRRRYRKMHGLCVECSYDLTGNECGVCPECGTPIAAEDSPTE